MPVDLTKHVSDKDVAWLLDQMNTHRISQRAVSRATGLDPSALSRSFAATRKMTMSEFAEALAYVQSVVPRLDTPLQRAFWDSRLTLAKLAAMTRLPLPRLHNIVKGHGEPPNAEEENRLRRALNGYAATGDAAVHRAMDPLPADHIRPFRTAASGIEVFAAPVPLGEGFYRRSDTVVDERPRPAPLAQASGAYAFFVGEGLSPRWYPGEVLFVHPLKPPVVGRWLVVELDEDRITVGRVMSVDDGLIELQRPAFAEPLRFPVGHLGSTGTIVGSWGE